MKIIRNEKLIKRNAKIGQYSSLAGLLVIVGTMVYLFQFMRTPEFRHPDEHFYPLGGLVHRDRSFSG